MKAGPEEQGHQEGGCDQQGQHRHLRLLRPLRTPRIGVPQEEAIQGGPGKSISCKEEG